MGRKIFPPAPRSGVTGGDLAQMWRKAAAFLPHFSGCNCSGPHLTLDRDAIEADLLAHLVQTYRAAGRAPLACFVAAREEAKAPRGPFAAWLAALDRETLDAADRDRLVADLALALQSLDATKSGSLVCE